MKKIRKVLAVLLVLIMAFGVLPMAVYADNDSSYGYIGFMCPEYNFNPDLPYMQIVYETGVEVEPVEGADYDSETNTLTLENYNLPLSLMITSMGDDFKLNLVGENSLDSIHLSDSRGNGCSVTFTGEGSLVVNEQRMAACAITVNACGLTRPTVTFGKDVNVVLYSGADEFGAIIKAEKVLDTDESPEPPIFVFENGQQVDVLKQDSLIFDGEIEGYRISKIDGASRWFGNQISNANDPDGLYTYEEYGYWDSNAEEWVNEGYQVKKINELLDGVYVEDYDYDGEKFASEDELFAAYPLVTAMLEDENPATLNNRLVLASHSSAARIYKDDSDNYYAYSWCYNPDTDDTDYYVCEYTAIAEMPGEYVVTPINGMTLDGLTYTGDDIGVFSFRDDGEPSSCGNIIDKDTADGVKYTATLITDVTDPENPHTDWHIHKFIYSNAFDMWFQDYSFNGEGEIEINPQDFETSEWNAFIYESHERAVEIRSYYDAYSFFGSICEDGEGHCCAIERWADINDDETVLYDYEDVNGTIIFTENTTFDKANFTVNDDAHAAEGVHDYSVLGQSLTVAAGEDNWEAYVKIVDNEGNKYTPEDVIEINVGEKRFFYCETDFENNPAHGVTPYVGFSENDEHIWTLTPAGFKVKGGTGNELGYEGIDSFGIEVDTTDMLVTTEAPLYCWLYEFDGKFPGQEGFDWNSLTKTNEFVFTFAVAPNEGWNHFADGHWEYIKEGEPTVGWHDMGGKTYYFDETGRMYTGWYYDGRWSYFSKSGELQLGWQKISGKWYYLGKDGYMRTGWQKISNKWYYFGKDGAMVTKWQKISKKWYYFGTDGVMVTKWQKISKKWYYFGTDGAMVTKWQKISKKWYYFGTDGVMVTKWQKISGKWYYFGTDGVMLANTSQKIGKKTYKFDANGVCKNP